MENREVLQALLDQIPIILVYLNKVFFYFFQMKLVFVVRTTIFK